MRTEGHASPQAFLAVALGLALIATIYWPGLGGGWVFDDFSNIIDNARLRVQLDSGFAAWRDAASGSVARDLPRPLAMLSFALDHALHGFDARSMKIANLAIHLLNLGLVFAAMRTLLRFPAAGVATSRADAIAAWIAIAWAANPINLMAVLFTVQRMESLSHVFVFAGLWLHLAGRLRLYRTGRGWPTMMLGLVLGGVGLLAKESAALLPLYAGLVELILLRDDGHEPRPQRRRIQAWFAGVLVVPALIGSALMLLHAPARYAGRSFTLPERLMTEARALVDYLHWTIAPDLGRMSLYHDAYPVSQGLLTPVSTLLSIVALLLLAGLAFRLRTRRPLAALGIAWFFAAHALTATVWPLELVFEHRNYFASLGVVLVLADLLLHLPQRTATRRLGWGVALLLLGAHAGATHLRAREWSDPLRFAASEAAKHPESPRATYDLARNLVILSDFDSESPYHAAALEALERAMAVPGSSPLPESAALLYAARTGLPQRAEWWERLRTKLRSRPTGLAEAGALATLSDCAIAGGCPLPQDEVIASFIAALERGPHPRVLHDYGHYALQVLGDADLALTLFGDAVALDPDEPAYRSSLVQLLFATGRTAEADEQIAQLRQRNRFGRHDALIATLEAARTRFAQPSEAPPTEPAQ